MDQPLPLQTLKVRRLRYHFSLQVAIHFFSICVENFGVTWRICPLVYGFVSKAGYSRVIIMTGGRKHPLLKCLSNPPLGFVHSDPSLLDTLGRPSRVEPIQLSVPGNLEQKSSSTGVTVRKKKSIGIRALSAQQRKDDHIRALLKEHLSEIRALLQREVPVPVQVRSKFQLSVTTLCFILVDQFFVLYLTTQIQALCSVLTPFRTYIVYLQ